MYNKEAKYVVNTLDTAIGCMSRAGYTLRVSTASTEEDKELGKKIYKLSENVRQIMKVIKTKYPDMYNR